MDTAYFLGVDGGATRCRARVRRCSGDYGSFAPLVFDAARDGDTTARSIIEAAAHAVGALARAVCALGAPRIALVGGLAGAIRSYLSAELDEMLRKPMFDAVDGAILLVGGALPKVAER